MDSPCAGCEAPCCVGRVVRLGPGDVLRIARTLGVSWDAFAALVPDDDGFLLAAAGAGHAFELRRGAGDACVLAVPLGRTRRCGVHDARPASCRVYPFHVTVGDGAPAAALGHDAACPPPLADAWRARLPQLLDDELAGAIAQVDEEGAAVARWNARVRRGGAFAPDDFLRFCADEP